MTEDIRPSTTTTEVDVGTDQAYPIYGTEEERLRSGAGVLVASVAEATSHRGLPYPPEWWPADAGPLPDVQPVASASEPPEGRPK